MTVPIIERDVLQATLDHALQSGGDFAEVFVEDRRSSSGRFDDGRVEELVSGRDRGAGLRVVRGETTGFAHTADLSRAGLLPAAWDLLAMGICRVNVDPAPSWLHTVTLPR